MFDIFNASTKQSPAGRDGREAGRQGGREILKLISKNVVAFSKSECFVRMSIMHFITLSQ